MNYNFKPTRIFLEQLNDLSLKSKKILKDKLGLIRLNPARNKRILGYNLFLFRVRLKDKSKEKRIIYLLDKNNIELICILNRDKNYKDLKKYLEK